jgi:D-alanyl-D-alanine carboxypeptidase
MRAATGCTCYSWGPMRTTGALISTVAALAATSQPASGASLEARAGGPTFHGTISTIGPKVRSRMVSWRPGCPVGPRSLRLLELDHWGFDGEVHRGRLIVHRDQARRMLGAMRRVFTARFPIKRMWLVDAYGGSDDRSMNANNTSAFNCRFVAGTQRWSEHAYGRAIDINPVQNPYVQGSRVSPARGRPYANRSRRHAGMIRSGDAVVRAFSSIGWGWGGYWSSAKDYQHFSASGR